MIRPKVLVVDDSLDRGEIVRVLQQGGYRVTTAATFEQATEILASAPPDVLITELRLGAFNGLHLIVRCRVRSPDVVAIVHTAFPDQVLEAEASRMNAEYLERPVDAVHLLATIARRLGAQPERRRSPREEAAPSVQVELGDVPATLVDASSSGLRLSLSVSVLPSIPQIRIPSLGISCRGTVVWLRRTAARPAAFLCGIEVTGGLDTPGWSWQQLLLHPGPRR